MCIEPPLPIKHSDFRKKQYDEDEDENENDNDNDNDKKIQSHSGVDMATISLKN
jgi:hypothetical protein